MTTRGIMSVLSCSACVRLTSLGTFRARWISVLRCSYGCPLFNRYPFSSSALFRKFSSSELILLSLSASPYGMAVLQCFGWQLLLLMCVSWFHMYICLYMMSLEVDPCIQEDYLLRRPGGGEFDGAVVFVEAHRKLLQGCFSVGPDGKDVVDISPPYQRLYIGPGSEGTLAPTFP